MRYFIVFCLGIYAFYFYNRKQKINSSLKISVATKEDSFFQKGVEDNFLPIIPIPNFYTIQNKKVVINESTQIITVDISNDSLKQYLQKVLNNLLKGNKIKTQEKKDNAFIFLKPTPLFSLTAFFKIQKEEKPPLVNNPKYYDIILKNNEAYEGEKYSIKCNNSFRAIEIEGNTKGLFYGIISLTHLINYYFNTKTQQVEMPYIKIIDSPTFAYRGLHLDVVRHFFSVDVVKAYLDLMSRYKLNKFHWHLTNDQGWRIESKKYPLLTKIGAYRPYTIVGRDVSKTPNYPIDKTPHRGFYTQKQIKEIVQYAQVRNIEVIPEISIPGHSTALLAAYPELGCLDKSYKVLTRWRHSQDLVCFTKEKTYSFIMSLFEEIQELFPSKYIHLGGDEADLKAWKKCPNCNKKMLKLKTNEKGLFADFFNRLSKELEKKGKKIILWDDEFNPSLDTNIILMVWKKPKNIFRALKSGYTTIDVSNNHYYLDHYQTNNYNKEQLAFKAVTTLKDIYFYPQKYPQLFGIQACLWTEYINSLKQIQMRLFPRLLAVAENGWTKNSILYYKFFLERVEKEKNWFKKNNIAFFEE